VIIENLAINGVNVEKCFLNEVTIEQSIYKPIIYGRVTFNDSYYKYASEILPGDSLTIEIKDVSENKAIRTDYTIYALQSETPQQEVLYHEVLFCSQFVFGIYSKKVTGYYNDELVSDIVEDLLKKARVNISKVEETVNKTSYTLPLWSIVNHISYLNRIPLNKTNGNGGYLLFPNFDGSMNYISRDYIIKERMSTNVLKIIDDDTIGYPGNVSSLNLEKEIDLIKSLEMGIGRLKISSFSNDTSNIEKEIISFQDIKRNRLTLNYPLKKSWTGFEENLYINNSSSEECNAILKNKLAKLSDPLVVNLQIPGSLVFKIGTIVNISYPSVIKLKEEDRRKTGWYLIQSIVTSVNIQESTHSQILSCVTDGYNKTNLKGLM